jgi:hypothetical protein
MQAPLVMASTGAIARYPMGRKPKFATKLNVFSDFTTQAFSQLANPLSSWALNLALLRDDEAEDWIEFQDAVKGQGSLFTFADPWANLLTWTEEFENAAWIKGGGLVVGKNYVTHSEDFSASDWVKGNNGGTGNPVVTPNFTAAPDGNITASKIAFPAAGTGNPEIFQIPTMPAVDGSSTFTYSVWLKTDTTGSISMSVGDNVSQGNTASQSLTATWQRFQVTVTFSSSASSTVSAVLFNPASSGAINVYAWGAQLQYGSTPSDYTKTTTAALELEIADPFWLPAPSGAVGASFGLNSAFPKRGRQIACTSTTNCAISQIISLAPGGSGNYRSKGLAMTASIYVKRQDASPPILPLFIFDSLASEFGGGNITPSASWVRISFPIAFSASNNAPLTYFQYGLGGSSGTVAGTFYVFGAQVDTESAPTRYKHNQAIGGVHPNCRFASDELAHSVDSYDQNTISSLVIQEYGG